MLVDLTDYLLARAGKRSVLHGRLTEDRLARAREKSGETAHPLPGEAGAVPAVKHGLEVY